MISNYFKIAIRQLTRYRLISFITVFGLSIGLAGSMFIFLWVTNELSFDRFHLNGDRLYRVEEDQVYSQGLFHVNVTPWPSGPVWKARIPEIEQSCRITGTGSQLFRYNDKTFYENNVLAVDSTFFEMFSFQLIAGDKRTALEDPSSVIITEAMAQKYFGSTEAIGKTLEVNTKEAYKVTGIMKKIPSNSSIQADFLVPFSNMKKSWWYSENWSTNSISTYVMLTRGANTGDVNKKLTAIVKEYSPETSTSFMLFPFLKIHLHAYGGFDRKPGAIVNIWIFSFIALMVLIIACINFMNLSTARSSARARETGLRKLSGAYRKDLMIQFFGEIALYTLLSLILSYIIVLVLLGQFNQLTGKEFVRTDLIKPVFITGSLLIALITSFVAGSYPSLVLSAFKPINVLKQSISGRQGKGLFGKISVVLQFTISIILILFTIVTYRQLRYMQNKSLGYDKENMIYLPIRGEVRQKYESIKEEFMKEPGVIAVSACTDPPHLIGSNADNIWWEGKSPDDHSLVSLSGVDFGYAEAMGITIKSGRTFSKTYSADIPHDSSGTFMINESLEKLIGKGDAVGQQLKFGGTNGQIIGVMKDFNYQSLREKIEPLAVWIWPSDYLGFIYIRIKPGDIHTVVNTLQSRWKTILPSYPFDFQFLDQEIDKLYRVEERMGSLLKYFSILAIIIACVGLFGLATYTLARRTREIGLRKVLGASAASLFMLVSKEFIQLLLIASAISVPLSIIVLDKYLSNFGYRISFGIPLILLALGIVSAVALAAISYQLITAIRSNPAKSLKYE